MVLPSSTGRICASGVVWARLAAGTSAATRSNADVRRHVAVDMGGDCITSPGRDAAKSDVDIRQGVGPSNESRDGTDVRQDIRYAVRTLLVSAGLASRR